MGDFLSVTSEPSEHKMAQRDYQTGLGRPAQGPGECHTLAREPHLGKEAENLEGTKLYSAVCFKKGGLQGLARDLEWKHNMVFRNNSNNIFLRWGGGGLPSKSILNHDLISSLRESKKQHEACY